MSDKPMIYEAMSKIMNDISFVAKKDRNQQQGFNFRGIDSVYNSLHDVMAKHKVFSIPKVLERHREERTTPKGTVLAFTILRMEYTFYAEDGSNVVAIVDGEGMDSGDKSSNKAMAIAHKYALLQTFCVPTEETKDPDADSHEVKAETPIPKEIKPMPRADKNQCAKSASAIIDALNDGEDSTAYEVWKELNDSEKAIVWKTLTTKQQAEIRRIVDECRTREAS